MASMEKWLMQHAVIESLTAVGCAPIDTQRRMTAVCDDVCVDASTVCAGGGQGPLGVTIQPRRTCITYFQPTIDNNHRYTASCSRGRTDSCQSSCQVERCPLRLVILTEQTHHIICEKLEYRKVCARWVSRISIQKMKQRRWHVLLKFLVRYEQEDDGFIRRIASLWSRKQAQFNQGQINV